MTRKGDTVRMVREGKTEVLSDREEQAHENQRLRNLERLKDSVAAHQAECSCHPVTFKSFGPIDEMACCDRKPKQVDAKDSTGQPWHLDPLCKVRPEART